MAVSISTVGINTANAGTWTRTEALDLLGLGLSVAQLHGSPQSGLVVGVSTFNGGGKVAISQDKYYQDVRPISTTGVGTGASFYIYRENDNDEIMGIAVNRPGYGYTGGEVVTISAEDIGGSVNGASNMELKLVIDANISGGSGYALTFTGTGSTSIQSRGYDKNGYQSIGTDRTYTFTEGDTISFHNDTVNEYSDYDYMGLVRYIDDRPSATAISIASTHYVWSYGSTNNVGITTSWTPSRGEAGTYFFARKYSENEDYTTIVVEPANSGNVTPVSYGSTTGWYDQNPEEDNNSAGRVLKLDVDSNKKFGTTYHMIFHVNGSELYTNGYAGWFPIDTKTRYNGYYQDGMNQRQQFGGHAYGKRWAGSHYLDGSSYSDIFNQYESMLNNTYTDGNYGMRYNNYQKLCDIPTSYTSYELNLKIYKSGLDPNFVVFIWKLPTLSSSDINDNATGCFFFHNFTTSVFDLDYYNLGTITRIDPYNSSNMSSGSIAPQLEFYTYLVNTVANGAKRSAMRGYAGDEDWYTTDRYEASPHTESNDYNATKLYYRPDSSDERYATRMTSDNTTYIGDNIPSSASSNNVIKGLPLNSRTLPCPYYIPDDFVLIQFDYNATSANIQNGDTVTISGSEVYEVITGSYDTNDESRTKGILFCARIV